MGKNKEAQARKRAKAELRRAAAVELATRISAPTAQAKGQATGRTPWGGFRRPGEPLAPLGDVSAAVDLHRRAPVKQRGAVWHIVREVGSQAAPPPDPPSQAGTFQQHACQQTPASACARGAASAAPGPSQAPTAAAAASVTPQPAAGEGVPVVAPPPAAAGLVVEAELSGEDGDDDAASAASADTLTPPTHTLFGASEACDPPAEAPAGRPNGGVPPPAAAATLASADASAAVRWGGAAARAADSGADHGGEAGAPAHAHQGGVVGAVSARTVAGGAALDNDGSALIAAAAAAVAAAAQLRLSLAGGPAAARTPPPAADVIDLTLDSPPPSPRAAAAPAPPAPHLAVRAPSSDSVCDLTDSPTAQQGHLAPPSWPQQDGQPVAHVGGLLDKQLCASAAAAWPPQQAVPWPNVLAPAPLFAPPLVPLLSPLPPPAPAGFGFAASARRRRQNRPAPVHRPPVTEPGLPTTATAAWQRYSNPALVADTPLAAQPPEQVELFVAGLLAPSLDARRFLWDSLSYGEKVRVDSLPVVLARVRELLELRGAAAVTSVVVPLLTKLLTHPDVLACELCRAPMRRACELLYRMLSAPLVSALADAAAAGALGTEEADGVARFVQLLTLRSGEGGRVARRDAQLLRLAAALDPAACKPARALCDMLDLAHAAASGVSAAGDAGASCTPAQDAPPSDGAAGEGASGVDVERPGGRHNNDFDDFRSVAIAPTLAELAADDADAFLPRRAPPGAPPRGFLHRAPHLQTLDWAFRLTRADMLAQIRAAVGAGSGRGPPRAKQGQMPPLEDVRVHASSTPGASAQVTFEAPPDVDRASSAFEFWFYGDWLMQGTLLCVLDGDAPVAFVEVAERRVQNLVGSGGRRLAGGGSDSGDERGGTAPTRRQTPRVAALRATRRVGGVRGSSGDGSGSLSAAWGASTRASAAPAAAERCEASGVGPRVGTKRSRDADAPPASACQTLGSAAAFGGVQAQPPQNDGGGEPPQNDGGGEPPQNDGGGEPPPKRLCGQTSSPSSGWRGWFEKPPSAQDDIETTRAPFDWRWALPAAARAVASAPEAASHREPLHAAATPSALAPPLCDTVASFVASFNAEVSSLAQPSAPLPAFFNQPAPGWECSGTGVVGGADGLPHPAVGPAVAAAAEQAPPYWQHRPAAGAVWAPWLTREPPPSGASPFVDAWSAASVPEPLDSARRRHADSCEGVAVMDAPDPYVHPATSGAPPPPPDMPTAPPPPPPPPPSPPPPPPEDEPPPVTPPNDGVETVLAYGSPACPVNAFANAICRHPAPAAPLAGALPPPLPLPQLDPRLFVPPGRVAPLCFPQPTHTPFVPPWHPHVPPPPPPPAPLPPPSSGRGSAEPPKGKREPKERDHDPKSRWGALPHVGVRGCNPADEAFLLSAAEAARDGRGRAYRLVTAHAHYHSTRSVLERLQNAQGVLFPEQLLRAEPPPPLAASPASADWAVSPAMALRVQALDGAQQDAYERALSHRVALVQGPPGTGKTRLGVMLAQALVDNGVRPVLCITASNHAVDQFLGALLDAGVSNVVRLGGGSKDGRLAARTLRALCDQSLPAHLRDAVPDCGRRGNATKRRQALEAALAEARLDRRVEAADVEAHLSAVDPAALEAFRSSGSDPEDWREAVLAARLADLARRRQAIADELDALREELVHSQRKERAWLCGADVIGATTAGAAIHHRLIACAGVRAVVVEEAAQVLEAHLLAVVPSSTERLVMIGDHCQLRPSVHLDRLKRHDFDVSLFERLVTAGFHYSVLRTQHRMRPAISAAVRDLMYPTLVDGPAVSQYPVTWGLVDDFVFVRVTSREQTGNGLAPHRSYGGGGGDGEEASGASFSNRGEAVMAVAAAQFFLEQGYPRDQVAVLTPYTGQRALIQHLMRRSPYPFTIGEPPRRADELSPGYETIRLSTVDNFQGEEADVVIVSLVRSNSRDGIGFLRDKKRINVALSRARHGLVLIGNDDCLRAGCRGGDAWDTVLRRVKVYNGLPVSRAGPRGGELDVVFPSELRHRERRYR